MQSTRNSGRLLGKEQKNYSTMDTTDPEKQEEVSASETASERLENSAVPEASSKSNDVTSPSQQNKVNHQLDIEVSNISSARSHQSSRNPLHEPMLSNSQIDIGNLYQFFPHKLLPRLLLYPSPNLNHRYSETISKKAIFILLQNHGKFKLISCLGNEGWIYVPDQLLLNTDIFLPISTYRAYEDWPGENFFYSDGYIMIGHDRFLCIGTACFIFVLSILFFACVIYKLLYFELYLVICIILVASVFINLYFTATSDPGIIPRNPSHVQPILPTGASTVGALGWRFCTTCNLYRPPRSKHCKTCQNCVEEFDHHCPYTGNCIGLRNARYFLRFVCSITLYSVAIMLMCLFVLIQCADENDDHSVGHRYAASIAENPVALMVGLVACGATIILLPFCCYHLQIRSKAQTTNEQVRGVYLSPDVTNPFDEGCWHNYASVCCSSIPPSKVPPLTRVHIVKDYVKAHIDPNKHPDIYTLYHHDIYESPT